MYGHTSYICRRAIKYSHVKWITNERNKLLPDFDSRFGASRAPSRVNRFSADFNCNISGADGKGKFTTLSIFIVFICKTKSSTGCLWISGTENVWNSSLNIAEEYNLEEEVKVLTTDN